MNKLSIKRALLITALSYIGMNFHHAVTPTLFTGLGLPSRIFGTSMAIMCFFTFLTAPFWGELSDRIGRVKVFAITAVFYGLAQYGLGQATTEAGVLLFRGLAGLVSSGVSFSMMSYVIDISDDEKKAENISIYTATMLVGNGIGYLIGGALGTLNVKLAFTMQAVWVIATGFVATFILKESVMQDELRPMGELLKNVNPFASFKNAGPWINRTMSIFLVVVFLTGFANACYDSAFNYTMKAQFNFLPIYNGIVKAIIGFIGLMMNFTVNIWIIRKTNVKKSLVVILLLCALSALCSVFANKTLWFIVFNLLFYSFTAVWQPIVKSLAVDKKPSNVTGILVGLINSLSYLGIVFGSLLAGFIYDFGNKLPFLLSSMVFILSVVFSFVYMRQKSEA